MEGELRIRVLRPDQPEALLARRVAQVHAALLEELLPELAPTPEEQAALLEKMDAYCREQAGMALADFRARYLVEEPQPRQAPSLAQL